MKPWNSLAMLVLFIAVCLAAGGLGAIFTASSVRDWRPALMKPSWTAPAWVFGPVWTTLYLMMAVAAWLVWRKRGFSRDALVHTSTIDSVFPFFADAGNLEIIAPPWPRFKILTPLPIAMQAGAIIELRLRLYGVALRWQTEITVWDPPLRFVDEQKLGPYRRWIHEHTLTECDEGCEMRDFVRYEAPGGRLTSYLFVQRKVRQIFECRARKLKELFA